MYTRHPAAPGSYPVSTFSKSGNNPIAFFYSFVASTFCQRKGGWCISFRVRIFHIKYILLLNLFRTADLSSIQKKCLKIANWGQFCSLATRTFNHFEKLSSIIHPSLWGREPWSSGYGKRLVFRRSWVRILTLYTGWTFFTFICCKNCDVCLKKRKKRPRIAHLKNIYLYMDVMLHVINRWYS